ncbi:hypothetical protein [Anabaena sp. CCY 9910]
MTGNLAFFSLPALTKRAIAFQTVTVEAIACALLNISDHEFGSNTPSLW